MMSICISGSFPQIFVSRGQGENILCTHSLSSETEEAPQRRCRDEGENAYQADLSFAASILYGCQGHEETVLSEDVFILFLFEKGCALFLFLYFPNSMAEKPKPISNGDK